MNKDKTQNFIMPKQQKSELAGASALCATPLRRKISLAEAFNYGFLELKRAKHS
jgi:hypothetical protein